MSSNHASPAAESSHGSDSSHGGDPHDDEPESVAEAPIAPITAGQLFQYLVIAAVAAVIVGFVPDTLPIVVAFAVATLMPRRTVGSLGLRLGLGVIAGLLALFVVRMWPGQPGPDELAPESPALLSWLIALPILSAVAVLFLPRQSPTLLKGFTLASMFGTLAVALPLLRNPMGRSFHYNYDVVWLAKAGIHYHVAVDGISLWLVMLTLFIVPIAAYASFGSITTRIKDWCFALLLLEGAMVGTFVSLDVIVFYIFFELGLVPMYLMIGVWGGTNRIKASIKFFLYTMFGSVLMLAAILYMGFHYSRLNGTPSFDFFDLQRMVFPRGTQVWLFAAFALAFFIKVPMFPVHTWLPDAHTEAPTAGSMILAAVMLKMGTYGYLRFCMGLFPEACSEYAATLAGVAVVGGILYGALCAWKQDDIKKLVAYSSVAHLGYVMLGLFANTSSSIEGSVLQMVNHGISTGLLFLLVGMVYDRRHTRHVDDYGGIAKVMPVYSALFIIATMASVGLPGTNGFVGEFMIITGTFVSTKLGHVNGIQAVGATLGVILAALYMLTMVQKVFFGPLNNPENKRLKDINPRELLAAAPLVAFVFIIGLFPRIFLDTMHDACVRVQSEMQSRVERYPGPSYYRGPNKLEARRPDAPKPVVLPAESAPQAAAGTTEPSLRVN